MLLERKAVFITGAARGIGRGIAQAVAEEGARVVISDLELAALAETESLLRESGAEVLCLAADVTDATRVSQAMEEAVNHYGSLDGLVNNAGVFDLAPSLQVERDSMAFQFEVNSLGVFNCCQCAARIMQQQPGGGSIVNIASNAGKVGFPGYVPYSASKAAVINMTQTLAKEWAALQINVNAVCPGGVDTPMLTGVAEYIASRSGGDAEQIRKNMCPPQLGRHVKPIEVGRVVAFLLSERAAIIRGQSINIDGGETPY